MFSEVCLPDEMLPYLRAARHSLVLAPLFMLPEFTQVKVYISRELLMATNRDT